MIVGLDVGYGYTKATNGFKSVVLPSVVGPSVDIKYQNGLITAGRGLKVEIGDRRQFIGELARLQSPFTTSPLARERDLDIVRILALTAIHQVHAEGGLVELVTGLPVSWYDDREELIDALRGCHDYRVNGEPITVKIRDVHVVPQPFGTLFAVLLTERGILGDPEQLADRKVAVIDVGTYTTDYALSDALRYIETRSGSTEAAMSQVYRMLLRKVETDYGIDIDLNEAELAARDGEITAYGEALNVSPLVRAAIDDVAETIVAEAESLWPDRGRTFAQIFVTGGGAPLMYGPLVDIFPHAHLVAEPQMANADGFYRYGLFKARQGSGQSQACQPATTGMTQA
jgi:plasmid segregation protein ParM